MLGLGGEFSIVDFSDTAGEARKEKLVGLGLIEESVGISDKGNIELYIQYRQFHGAFGGYHICRRCCELQNKSHRQR